MPDIDFGQLSEALNDKSDRDLRNVDTTAKADAVIDYQEPTAANNYTWYRKYASGYVEQGGVWSGSISAGSNADGYATVTIPVEMLDINYCVNITNNAGSNTISPWEMWCVESLTTTQFRIHMGAYAGTRTVTRMTWQVSGMAAN